MGLFDFLDVCAVLVRAQATLAYHRSLLWLSSSTAFGTVCMVLIVAILLILFGIAAACLLVDLVHILYDFLAPFDDEIEPDDEPDDIEPNEEPDDIEPNEEPEDIESDDEPDNTPHQIRPDDSMEVLGLLSVCHFLAHPFAIITIISIIASFCDWDSFENCYDFVASNFEYLAANLLTSLAILSPVAVTVLIAAAMLVYGLFGVLYYYCVTLPASAVKIMFAMILRAILATVLRPVAIFLAKVLLRVLTSLITSHDNAPDKDPDEDHLLQGNGLAHDTVSITSTTMVIYDIPPHLDRLLISNDLIPVSINAPAAIHINADVVLVLSQLQTRVSANACSVPHTVAETKLLSPRNPTDLSPTADGVVRAPVNTILKAKVICDSPPQLVQLPKGNGPACISANAKTPLHIIADIKAVLPQPQFRVSTTTCSGMQTVAETEPLSSRTPTRVSSMMTKTFQTVAETTPIPFQSPALDLIDHYERGLRKGRSQALKVAQFNSIIQALLAQAEANESYQRGLADGNEQGFSVVLSEGEAQGFSVGRETGRQQGLSEGEAQGFLVGREVGRRQGFSEGEEQGRSVGLEAGRQQGFSEGEKQGLLVGREAGRREGVSEGEARGREAGLQQGELVGFEIGHSQASREGEASGLWTGYALGFEDGETTGLRSGFDWGFEHGEQRGFHTGITQGIETGRALGRKELRELLNKRLLTQTAANPTVLTTEECIECAHGNQLPIDERMPLNAAPSLVSAETLDGISRRTEDDTSTEEQFEAATNPQAPSSMNTQTLGEILPQMETERFSVERVDVNTDPRFESTDDLVIDQSMSPSPASSSVNVEKIDETSSDTEVAPPSEKQINASADLEPENAVESVIDQSPRQSEGEIASTASPAPTPSSLRENSAFLRGRRAVPNFFDATNSVRDFTSSFQFRATNKPQASLAAPDATHSVVSGTLQFSADTALPLQSEKIPVTLSVNSVPKVQIPFDPFATRTGFEPALQVAAPPASEPAFVFDIPVSQSTSQFGQAMLGGSVFVNKDGEVREARKGLSRKQAPGLKSKPFFGCSTTGTQPSTPQRSGKPTISKPNEPLSLPDLFSKFKFPVFGKTEPEKASFPIASSSAAATATPAAPSITSPLTAPSVTSSTAASDSGKPGSIWTRTKSSSLVTASTKRGGMRGKQSRSARVAKEVNKANMEMIGVLDQRGNDQSEEIDSE